jgi:hypothetical protein
VTEGAESSPAAPGPTGSPPVADLDGSRGRPGPGEPARPGTFEGRASTFRQAEAVRRRARRERYVEVVLVAVILIGSYSIVAGRSDSTSIQGFMVAPIAAGPPILVHLISSATDSSVSCGGGGTAYVENITWFSSSQPLYSSEVFIGIYEIWDGDPIPDLLVVPNATASSVCAGTPPGSGSLWYLVLAAPNGTNLLTYDQTSQWAPVGSGASDVLIASGSNLVLVSNTALSNTGRGLKLIGSVDGSQITGSVAL